MCVHLHTQVRACCVVIWQHRLWVEGEMVWQAEHVLTRYQAGPEAQAVLFSPRYQRYFARSGSLDDRSVITFRRIEHHLPDCAEVGPSRPPQEERIPLPAPEPDVTEMVRILERIASRPWARASCNAEDCPPRAKQVMASVKGVSDKRHAP